MKIVNKVTEDTKEDTEDIQSITHNNTPASVNIPIHPTFLEGKERLALIAMEITEDIDENVGKLKELLKYTRPGMIRGTREEEVEMVRIGLITAIAVFKDILPGYSIRPQRKPNAKPKSAKTSRSNVYSRRPFTIIQPVR